MYHNTPADGYTVLSIEEEIHLKTWEESNKETHGEDKNDW